MHLHLADKTDFDPWNLCLAKNLRSTSVESIPALVCVATAKTRAWELRFCFHVQPTPLGPPPACAPPRPCAVGSASTRRPRLQRPTPPESGTCGVFSAHRDARNTTPTATCEGDEGWSPAAGRRRLDTCSQPCQHTQLLSCSHDPPEAAKLHGFHRAGKLPWFRRSSCP